MKSKQKPQKMHDGHYHKNGNGDEGERLHAEFLDFG